MEPPTGPRVLIVEDDASYAIQLLRALREETPSLVQKPISVDVATNVEEALQFLNTDAIDIYIIDLKLSEGDTHLLPTPELGRDLAKMVIEKTNAGVIIHSSLPADSVAAGLIVLGADDYIQKGTNKEILKAKVLALWRRIQFSRPSHSKLFVHTDRIFQIGDWYFSVGRRDLVDGAGNVIRISATEHAFLRHLCTVEGNEIDRETFNVEVLGRASYEKDMRIDNLVYRLRNKLGENLQIVSLRDGAYKLLNVKEVETILPPNFKKTA